MKRVVPILLVTVLLLSMSVAAKEPAANAALKAEITWWNFPNFLPIDGTPGKYEQMVIRAFNQKYPNIKVNMEMIDFASGPEKIVTAIQGGTAPDVLFDAPGRIIDYGKNGVLANLNDMFTKDFVKDVNNKNVINACRVGKNFYMYPISTAPFLMAFNKDMLQKHGLLNMLPTEGDRTWTTKEYTALLKALKAKGERGAIVFCGSQGGDQGTRAFIANLFDSSITDEAVTKYTINNKNGVKGLQYVVDAINEGLLLNGSASDGTAAIDEFCAQRVSHTILFSPGLQAVKQDMIDFDPIMVPFPSEDGIPELEYLIDGFCVFDNGDANRIKASKLLIDFICNDPVWGPKNVMATNTFPARSSFGNLYKGDETMTFLAGLSKYYAPYYNTIDGFAVMRTAWFPMLQAAFSGEKTPKKALDDFVKVSNASIKR